MLGKTVKDLGLNRLHVVPYFGVKEAVMPFEKFPEVDPVLGPEMRSTGEVLGLAETFGLAYYKSQEAAGSPLPIESGKLLEAPHRGDRVGVLLGKRDEHLAGRRRKRKPSRLLRLEVRKPEAVRKP